MVITTASEQETIEIARTIAGKLTAPSIIFLSGPLGAGKSVFARALIRTLMNDNELEVPSPTFSLVQIYDINNSNIYHYDLYRLNDPEEIFELGWEESLNSGITIIEWPERLEHYRPDNVLDIHIRPSETNSDNREILLSDNQY